MCGETRIPRDMCAGNTIPGETRIPMTPVLDSISRNTIQRILKVVRSVVVYDSTIVEHGLFGD